MCVRVRGDVTCTCRHPVCAESRRALAPGRARRENDMCRVAEHARRDSSACCAKLGGDRRRCRPRQEDGRSMRRSLSFVLLGVAEAAQQTQLVQRKRENAIMPRSWRRKSDTPVTRALLYANAIAYVALFQRSGAFRALAKNDRMIKSSRLQSYRLLSSI